VPHALSLSLSFSFPPSRSLAHISPLTPTPHHSPPQATAFAVLKLQDARGDTRHQFGSLISSSTTAVHHALAHIGVAPRNQLLTTSAEVPNARAPRCGTPSYARNGRARDLFNSLVGQLNNKHACYDLIAAEELRTARFAHVIYSRPDLSWPVAVRPYCFWNLGTCEAAAAHHPPHCAGPVPSSHCAGPVPSSHCVGPVPSSRCVARCVGFAGASSFLQRIPSHDASTIACHVVCSCRSQPTTSGTGRTS
jgi:hypothetical protein